MNKARVKDGIVVNIEVTDQEGEQPDGSIFVPILENEVAHINFPWSESDGFSAPTDDDLRNDERWTVDTNHDGTIDSGTDYDDAIDEVFNG